MLKDCETYLGKKVYVKVDRKMGEKHPEYNFVYPINYGYIPNTISNDGEEIDVYIIGVFEPVNEFTGICKAIIYRENDIECKLVAMPEEKEYSVSQIEALTEFQERFFKIKILVNKTGNDKNRI